MNKLQTLLSGIFFLAFLSIVSPALTQPPHGKVITLHGDVEHHPSTAKAWKPAQVFQNLFSQDQVRTLQSSRTDILWLMDQTQLKLGALSIVTVQVQPQITTLELTQGKIWVSKNNVEGRVVIKSTAGNVEMKSTEINVEIRPGNETVVTVVEGTVEFSNAQGRIAVNAKEEATARPGVAPSKRTIINPEDAVQWALYYPASFAFHDLPAAAKSGTVRYGFERLRQGNAQSALTIFTPLLSGNVWARIGASMAYLELGKYESAREVLNANRNGATQEAETERKTQLAAVALATGDVSAALAELKQVMSADSRSLRALSLLSSIHLIQNRKKEALAAARLAVQAHPKSVTAHVIAGEAAQAYFSLSTALRLFDRALALDPDEPRALINRARLRFGSGDTKGAQEDAERAAQIAPNDAQRLSLIGFIRLAQGDHKAAMEYFNSAIQADTDFGEPHLGLGLVYFRQERVNEGLLEMLTATLLEPKVSLYQSYLGKAFYQLHRFEEGLAALTKAKRHDPHDPTPWLYASFFLRDMNRQAEALDELRRAIALNDNRAVYRSRFLLDRDLATKNVSLAEVYRQLGFEAWGAAEGLNSLNADFTNAGAHLFLANTYLSLPDRQQALSSEFLQYFLYAPVNRNSFNSFNEYTALLEQPRRQLYSFEEIGNERHLVLNLGFRGGNERFAYSAFLNYLRENGARLDKNDTGLQGFVHAKIALGSKTDVLVSVTKNDTNEGQETAAQTINLDTLRYINIRRVAPDPNNTIRSKVFEGTLGLKHLWGAGSAFTMALQANEIKHLSQNPSSPLPILPPFLSSDTVDFKQRVYNFQVQQATRLGRHQTIIGVELQRELQNIDSRETWFLPVFNVIIREAAGQSQTRNNAFEGWLQDHVKLFPALEATIGVRYQNVEIPQTFFATSLAFRRWNPLLGVSLRLTKSTLVRAAAFRRLNKDIASSNIFPPTVAGFLLDRNELPATQRREAAIALEQSLGKTFLMAQAFYRKIEDLSVRTRYRFAYADLAVRQIGFDCYLNQMPAQRWSLFADNQYRQETNAEVIRRDNQVRVGLNFIHEAGFFLRLTNAYITQRFSNTSSVELPNATYNLADVELKYEFFDKHGRVTLQANNVFDRKFNSFVEGLSLQRPQPKRTIIAIFDWRF